MAPKNIIGAIFFLALFLFLGFKSIEKNNYFANRTLIITILISLMLFFVGRWMNDYRVITIAQKIGISNGYLLLIVSLLLALPSYKAIRIIVDYLNNNGISANGINDNYISKYDLLFIIVVTVFVSNFDELRPFSLQNISTDSAVFYYIGKNMTLGKLPYVDMFDHKGIILYFINYIAALIGHNSFIGVWLVNSIAIFFSAYFLFKLSLFITKKRSVSYITVITLFIIYIFRLGSVDMSNVTEVYALPFISYSMYIFIKYFVDDKYCDKDIVFLGISFLIVFFLRINMISVWMFFLPAIVINLLIKKNYTDILKCALLFIAGIVIVFIPVLFYFIKTNSLKEMIECYILFNFGYTSEKTSYLEMLKTMIMMCYRLIIPVSIPYLLLTNYRKDRIYYLNLCSFILALLMATISGRDFPHYSIVLYPMLTVILSQFFNSFINIKLTENKKLISVLICVLLIVVPFLYKPIQKTAHEVDTLEDYILKNTDKDDNLLIMNNKCWYYLYTDRYSNCRYFWPSAVANDEMLESFSNEINNKKPEYIFSTGKRENRIKEKGYIGDTYRLVDKLDNYTLFEYEDFYVYVHN